MTASITATWNTIFQRLRSTWTSYFLIHAAYTALGLAILTPLVGFAMRSLLALGGRTAVADQDIAWFLLSPLGMASLVLVVGLVIAVVAVEQAAMMAVAAGSLREREVHWVAALKFAFAQAPAVISFAWRLVLRVLLIVLPFLAIAAVAAWFLITEHDINFYLSTRPPEFMAAVAIGGVLALVMATILVSRLADWSLALPLILFRDTAPREAFDESQRMAAGCRREVVVTLLIWAALAILLGIAMAGVTDAFGSWLVPRFFDSIEHLVVALGVVVVVVMIGSLFAGALTGGSFALAIMSLYRRHGPGITAPRFISLASELRQEAATRSAWRVMSILATLAAVAVGAGAWLLSSASTPDTALVVAHRGAAGRAPENTLASIRAAMEDRTDWVEIDVQETLDGQVVVVHDSDFMKLSGVPLKVWDGTLEQLQQIDIGSWYGSAFADERVPTLETVLETVRASESNLVIELKYYGHDQDLERRVVELVEHTGMTERVAIMSLKYQGIQKVRGLRPDWNIGLLAATALGDLTRLDADFLAVNLGMAQPAFIRQAHKAGKKVFVWTVNDPVTMSRVLSLGVDGVITDEPAMAREVIADRAELSTGERLLVYAAVIFGKPLPQRSYRDDSP